MKHFKFIVKDRNIVILARDSKEARTKLNKIKDSICAKPVKDQKQLAKFTKVYNNSVSEGFIFENRTGYTFTSPQNPKDDKDFQTLQNAEAYAKKLGYMKDSAIKDADIKAGQIYTLKNNWGKVKVLSVNKGTFGTDWVKLEMQNAAREIHNEPLDYFKSIIQDRAVKDTNADVLVKNNFVKQRVDGDWTVYKYTGNNFDDAVFKVHSADPSFIAFVSNGNKTITVRNKYLNDACNYIKSGSEKALQKNIEKGIKSGKDPKQAAAIAYSIQRENDDASRISDTLSNSEAEMLVQKFIDKYKYTSHNLPYMNTPKIKIFNSNKEFVDKFLNAGRLGLQLHGGLINSDGYVVKLWSSDLKNLSSADNLFTIVPVAKGLGDSAPITDIKDGRLSPMTYKKLKELGYDRDKWQNLTQEQANKIVQSNGTSNSNSGNKSTSTKPSRQQQIQSAYNRLKKESEAAFDKFKNKATTLAERDQYEKEYNQVQAKMSKFLNKYDLNNRESVSKLNSEFEKTRYVQPKTARTNNKQIIENNKQKTRKLLYPSHEVAQGIEEFADAKSTEDRRAIIKDLRNTAIRNAERNKTNVCEGSDGEKYKFDITDGSNYSKAFRMALGGVPVTVNGRIARVKFVTPDEYLAQSAKQKGISTSELLTNTDDEAYQNVLSGLKKDKKLSSGIYMDYSNKSQEGNRRVRALKELGVTSIPVLYVGRKWDKEKDNIALHY